MLYDCKDPNRPRSYSLGPTEISAVIISGTTIYFGLGINPGTNLLFLNEKSKTALRNMLSEMKLLIIDESMVYESIICLWYQVIYGHKLTQGWEKYLWWSLKKYSLVLQLWP